MSQKSAHEPQAQVMNADEVWKDAQRVANVLQENLLATEPMVKLQIPLSVFLSALDSLNREELILLRERVEERLA